MTLEERSNIVLAFARTLFVNDQSTEQMLATALRLGDTLGIQAHIIPRWGELQLQSNDGDERYTAIVAADPVGVDMARVVSAARAISGIDAGRIAPDIAMEMINAISKASSVPTWLFAVAAASGAVALAVLFGLHHWNAAAIIFMSAGAGGFCVATCCGTVAMSSCRCSA